MKISAVIICGNEERRIGRCLDSLAGWIDEIVVVDSGSTDRTREIARSVAAVRLIEADWQGYSANKNLGNLHATGDYILSVDADEEISPELREEIRTLGPRLDGRRAFAMRRLARYGGRWIRHSGWYPDWQLRLFPRAGSRWDGALVHEEVVLPPGAATERLAGHLVHHAYDSIAEHIAKANAYSSLRARDLAGGRWLVARGIVKAKIRFLKHYVAGGGFLDGFPGFCIATIAAFAVLMAHLKARELTAGDGVDSAAAGGERV